jgi:hypothetical protein
MSCVYEKPYHRYFDSVVYPIGWCILNFMKFNGEDSRTTWEHVSQYLAQLGEYSSVDAWHVRLLCFSLTRTAFSWFSSFSPNFIFLGNNWNTSFMITFIVLIMN